MVNTMKLPLGSQCVKYLMFVFNLLFVITGIILLCIGVTIHSVYHSYQHFLDNKFLSVPSLLIAIGTIIFFIAFFGCCGAVRENYCMIITFTSLLVLVFVMELSGGISGYVLRARASTIVESKMEETLKEYGVENNTEIKHVWDTLQRQFQCCGINNASDWKIVNQTALPVSCCDTPVGAIGTVNCTIETPPPHLHTDGCYHKFLVYVGSHALQLGGVGIGIAIVQAIGIWFSIYLARSIRNSYETV